MCLLALLMASTNLYAQPDNDDCANAIVITEGTNQAFTTEGATTDGSAHADDCPSGGTTPDITYNDVWYSYTASFTGEAEWSFCGLVDFDTKIFVYGPGSACPPGDGDIVGCNEDAPTCGVSSVAIFPVTMGETYLLRVGGYGDGAPGESGSGAFNLTEYDPPIGPDNDDCADAIPIMLGTGQPFDNSGAQTDGPEHPGNPCFGFGDNTVQADMWYSFTAPNTASILWSTCDLTTLDTRMAIYAAGATCPVEDGDLWACNDDGPGCMDFTSSVIFDVVAGETYLLRFGGYDGGTGTGTMDLIEIIPPEPPANDLCTEPEDVFVMTVDEANNLTYIFEGTTIASSFDSDAFQFPKCIGNTNGGEFGDVWYTFDPQGRTEIEVRFSNQTENAAYYFDLWEDCDSLAYAPVTNDCFSFDGTTGGTFWQDTILNIPESHGIYYIRVTTRFTSDTPGDFWFQLVGDPVIAVKELALEDLSFFPNPVTNTASLQFNLPEATDIEIAVNDVLGQTVYQQNQLQMMAGEQNLSLDLADMTPGIYMLSIRSGDRVKSLKFVKQ